MIELRTRPGVTQSRAQFVSSHPPYSIALDGYVHGEPFLELRADGPLRNFNHHEAVDRSCMMATCEQARRAILLGLYDLFRISDERRALLWVNDCDHDVCLSTWLLQHPERADEPLVQSLTHIEDLLDSSSGTFPLPHENDLLGEVRWVFEPYARVRNKVTGMAANEMVQVIAAVHERIDRFTAGDAEKLPLTGKFRRIGGGAWWMAEVDRPHSRQLMVAAGAKAAVEVTPLPKGRYRYTVWRRSEYIAWFPVAEIFAALNAAEGIEPDDPDRWGGADNVGGSPRRKASKLPPAQVEALVEQIVATARARTAR